MMKSTKQQSAIQQRAVRAFSLLEVLAVVTIMGIVSVVIVTRVTSNSASAKINACYLNKANLDVQSQRWYRNKGSWPASNLSDITADGAYLPDGMPICPYDGAAYGFSSSTQQVTGHDH